MTTTTESAARFGLDEQKARVWLARCIAQAEALDSGDEPSDPDETLPEITGSYRASSGDYADQTALLVQRALADGVISDPGQGDLASLTWEFIPSDGSSGWLYRWMLSAGPGNLITVTYPSPDDPWGLGLNEDNREIAGLESALSVLREAVQAGNELQGRLDEYVAWLPLTARASGS